MLLVYGSDLYSGIDFITFIILSLMSFSLEVISSAPTLENKHSIVAFNNSEWTVSMRNLEIVYCSGTLNVCVFCISLCVSNPYFIFFFFGLFVQTVSPPLSHLNTLRRYWSCAGQAASLPFRLWMVTGSWLPVRLNQYFPRWGLMELIETTSS